MGKVHRIKKDFQRLVSQPFTVGRHSLDGCTSVYVGKSYADNFFLMHMAWNNRYKPLINKLIREYEAGVGHTDKSPVKD